MPALFIGHGSPMNAIEDNPWSRGFRDLAERLPRPRAILSVSAHWYVNGTFVTGNERPETIHDFGGFPPELYAMQYPAPGDVALAQRVVRLLGETNAFVRTDWGLDHGTWTVLHYLVPKADVPVVQLSIDYGLSAQRHLEIGRMIGALRDEGVLVLGSGNIVHNLRHAMMSLHRGETATPGWAEAFDADVAKALEQRDGDFLARAAAGDAFRTAHPTPDHYLPLLYVAGAAREGDGLAFPVTGFDLASLSMRAALFG